MTRPNSNFDPFQRKMAAAGSPAAAIESFKHYYARLVQGQTGTLAETDIQALDDLPDIERQPTRRLAEIGNAGIQRAAIIKLNGGLGTSMGMQQAKSLLVVKKGLSFLDIIVRQAQRLPVPVPVVFMNSFATQQDTRKALDVYPHLSDSRVGLDFLQHRIPKVDAETLTPAEVPEDPGLEWCPPGHGDIYLALQTSGMLDRLLAAGCEYAFISNADNLGAVLDPVLLGYFIDKGLTFMMEAAYRTPMDRKGGHLARLKSGRYGLREIAQTPESDLEAFQDIDRHPYFNTNNIWLHLPTLESALRESGFLKLPMICNRKPVNPRDAKSKPVYQLETAMGAAISVFEAAGAIRVPRSRFTPVKSTSDLLAVRSDSYILTDRYQLVPNPQRRLEPLRIDLDPDYYRLVDHFESRFPFGVPSLLACESLQINGDVRFGRAVTLTGSVSLVNSTDQPYEIADRRQVQGALHI
jgi:UTP--glucose-1-phosphate uridylyltransferase